MVEDTKMKSLFFTNSGINLSTGGGNISYHLAKTLNDNSTLSHIFCNCHGMNGDVMFGESHVPFTNIHPNTYKQPFSPFLIDYFSLVQSIVLQEPPDISLFYGDPFSVTAVNLKTMGSKIIVDLAPHNVEESKQEFSNLRKFFPEAPVYNFPHLTDTGLWGLYSEEYRIADLLIVHGVASGKYIQERAGLKKKPIVIPHGCILPDKVIDFPKKFTVGHLGVIGADKGQIYLAQAWQKMNPHIINLFMVGNGLELFKRWKLNNATIQNHIDNISDFYNNITIYVQPSVTEGFGIPVLEAMAHGRPVICTTGAGACDLISDGVNGFTIPIRSPRAIQEKIEYLASNPKELKEMGENARKTAEGYTWPKIRDKYWHLIKGLL